MIIVIEHCTRFVV